MQQQYRFSEINCQLMSELQTEQATIYYTVMSFQLGVAIGELVGMGVPPGKILETVDQLVLQAVKTRSQLSVDTKQEKANGTI